MKYAKYTDEKIELILKLVDLGYSYNEIVDELDVRYPYEKHARRSVRGIYYKHRDVGFGDDVAAKAILANERKRKGLASSNRKIKILSEITLDNEKLLEEIKKYIKKSGKTKKIEKKKNKGKSTIEVIISDVHVGVTTKDHSGKRDYCFKKALNYANKLSSEIISLVEKEGAEEVILACLGDMIHGTEMHHYQWDSCEFEDAKQVVGAIEILKSIIDSIVKHTKANIKIIGIAGNHDRVKKNKKVKNVGANYFSYVIYKSLEMMYEGGRVSFTIPEGHCIAIKIYGRTILYEHGDALSSIGDIKKYASFRNARELLVQKKVDCIRHGHLHYPMAFLGDSIVSNGSWVSRDDWAIFNGFCHKKEANQTIIIHKKNYPSVIIFFSLK